MHLTALVMLRCFVPVLLMLIAGPRAHAQVATSVTFTIDMTDAITAGWFDPEAEAVGVRGGAAPLAWDRSTLAEDPDGDGVYEVTLPFEVPGDSLAVAYKFHAAAGGDAPNSGWEAGRNRTVTVRPGQPATVARRFDEPLPDLPRTFTGTIEVVEDVPSAHLVLPRDLYVYLPPGYQDDLDRRYPVLYLHDGQHVFDAGDGAEWGWDEAAERLIAEGTIEPVIIVGVGNTSARTDEYTQTARGWRYTLTRAGVPSAVDRRADPTGLQRFTGTYRLDADTSLSLRLEVRGDALVGRLPGETAWNALDRVGPLVFDVADLPITMQFEADDVGRIVGLTATKPPEGGRGLAYGRFLVEELKPAIDAQYRTDPDRAALGGSSLGGLVTLVLGLEYPEVYDDLLAVAPAVWWDDWEVLRRVAALEAPTGQRVWLSMGAEETKQMRTDARTLRAALLAKGWAEGADLAYLEDEGGHNEASWSKLVPDLLRFLYGTDR